MATAADERLGIGCLGRAKDDEPVFVLRAQDILAPLIVKFWAAMAEHNRVNARKVDAAHQVSVDMERWQNANGGKVPD